MIYHTGIACRTADGTHLSIVPLYVIYHIVQTAKSSQPYTGTIPQTGAADSQTGST